MSSLFSMGLGNIFSQKQFPTARHAQPSSDPSLLALFNQFDLPISSADQFTKTDSQTHPIDSQYLSQLFLLNDADFNKALQSLNKNIENIDWVGKLMTLSEAMKQGKPPTSARAVSQFFSQSPPVQRSFLESLKLTDPGIAAALSAMIDPAPQRSYAQHSVNPFMDQPLSSQDQSAISDVTPGFSLQPGNKKRKAAAGFIQPHSRPTISLSFDSERHATSRSSVTEDAAGEFPVEDPDIQAMLECLIPGEKANGSASVTEDAASEFSVEDPDIQAMLECLIPGEKANGNERRAESPALVSPPKKKDRKLAIELLLAGNSNPEITRQSGFEQGTLNKWKQQIIALKNKPQALEEFINDTYQPAPADYRQAITLLAEGQKPGDVSATTGIISTQLDRIKNQLEAGMSEEDILSRLKYVSKPPEMRELAINLIKQQLPLKEIMQRTQLSESTLRRLKNQMIGWKNQPELAERKIKKGFVLLDPEKKQKILTLAKAGLGPTAIARQTGVNPATISQLIKNSPIYNPQKPKSSKYTRKKYTDEQRENCVKLATAGVPRKEIASSMNIPSGTIGNWLIGM